MNRLSRFWVHISHRALSPSLRPKYSFPLGPVPLDMVFSLKNCHRSGEGVHFGLEWIGAIALAKEAYICNEVETWLLSWRKLNSQRTQFIFCYNEIADKKKSWESPGMVCVWGWLLLGTLRQGNSKKTCYVKATWPLCFTGSHSSNKEMTQACPMWKKC